MKIGFVGLGKMGMNMVQRLMEHNQEVIAYDLLDEARDNAKALGAEIAESLEDLIEKLDTKPKIVWVMLPPGAPTENVLQILAVYLKRGDILIDGGNSHYHDSQRLNEKFESQGIQFLDVGTSGGVSGLETGFCFMVGGEKEAFKIVEPLFKILAIKNGYNLVGVSGAGHFTKMVHNGIEYGIMASYAEGFAVLNANKEFNIDMQQISKLWNHGSIIRSWLLKLIEEALEKDPKLEDIKGYIGDSGEGKWFVQEALNLLVSTPLIASSLFQRFHSRNQDAFNDRMVAALRNKFGGHSVKYKKES